MSFNLMRESFIRAITVDGVTKQYNLLSVITDSPNIRRLAGISVLDDVSIYRLLVAAIASVVDGPYDQQTLDNVDDIVDKLSKKSYLFDIFDIDKPFMQDPSLRGQFAIKKSKKKSKKKPNPVANLFIDIPAGTNINYFNRVFDSTTVMCPACCATGIIRSPAFCVFDCGQKEASINSVVPIYTVPLGDTLHTSLIYGIKSLVRHNNDVPCWDGITTSGPIGPLEGLTWQPRRTILQPLPSNGRRCTRCGSTSDVLVNQIIYIANRRPAEKCKREWRDPFVMYDVNNGKPCRPTNPLSNINAGFQLPIKIAENLISNPSSAAMVAIGGDKRRGVSPIICVTLEVNQAKAINTSHVTFMVPCNLFNNTDNIKQTLSAFNDLKADIRHSTMYKGRCLYNDKLDAVDRNYVINSVQRILNGDLGAAQQPEPAGQLIERPALPSDDLVAFIKKLSELPQHKLDLLKQIGSCPLSRDMFDVFNFLWRGGKDCFGNSCLNGGGLRVSRLSFTTVVSLFPWLPTTTGESEFGLVARRLMYKSHGKSSNNKSIGVQFKNVVGSDISTLRDKMLPLVISAASWGISIDWASILRDVASWDKVVVRNRWKSMFDKGVCYVD